MIVGENAKNKLNIDPLNTVSSVKRLIGRGKKDLSNKSNFFPYKFDLSDDRFLKVETRKGIFSPVEISSEILKFLNKRALEFLKRDIDGVVIIPNDIAENVIKETEEYINTESQLRKDILSGVDPKEAYLKYRVF